MDTLMDKIISSLVELNPSNMRDALCVAIGYFEEETKSNSVYTFSSADVLHLLNFIKYMD